MLNDPRVGPGVKISFFESRRITYQAERNGVIKNALTVEFSRAHHIKKAKHEQKCQTVNIEAICVIFHTLLSLYTDVRLINDCL